MKLFVVEWLDAYSEDGAWEEMSEFSFVHHHQYSVGFPVAMDDYYLLLVSSVDPELPAFFQGMCIPLGMIRSASVVREIHTEHDDSVMKYLGPATQKLEEFAQLLG